MKSDEFKAIKVNEALREDFSTEFSLCTLSVMCMQLMYNYAPSQSYSIFLNIHVLALFGSTCTCCP